MKVIYKKSIYDKILEAVIKASSQSKKIEKILLNKEEYEELEEWAKQYYKFIYFSERTSTREEFIVAGVRIELENE